MCHLSESQIALSHESDLCTPLNYLDAANRRGRQNSTTGVRKIWAITR